jgi:hypothetical protein
MPQGNLTEVALRVRVSPKALTKPTWSDLCRFYGLAWRQCGNTIKQFNDTGGATQAQSRGSDAPSNTTVTVELGG